MGATNFYHIAEGTDYKSAFNMAVRDAEFEYGYDPYNGTISTTHLSGAAPRKVSEKYGKASFDKAMKLVEKDGWGAKWVSRVIDMGIIGYEVVTYEKTPRTSAAAATKFETVYVGYAELPYDGTNRSGFPKEICVCKTAADAKKRVKAYMDAHIGDGIERFYVEKEVRKVEKGSPTTTFEMVRKTRVTKSKPKNAKNAKAIHKWLFYGWASI